MKKSRLISLVNWYHVASTMFPYIMMALIAVFIFQFSYSLFQTREQVKELVIFTISAKPEVWVLGWQGTVLTLVLVYVFARMEAPVYLLDFTTFQPPDSWKVTHAQLIEMMRRQQCFSEESIGFMTRVLEKSGTGQATAWPPSIVQCLKDGKPQDRSVKNARAESEEVVYRVIEDCLKTTNTKAEDIDILIINCSLFSPTPSLCALAAHRFHMRSDLASFNLSGMGCSASLIAIDLAKNLLRSRPNALALVVSTENLTQNLYLGNDRSMLLQVNAPALLRCLPPALLRCTRALTPAPACNPCVCVASTSPGYLSRSSSTCVPEHALPVWGRRDSAVEQTAPQHASQVQTAAHAEEAGGGRRVL